jgi:hypothetical protein
MPYRTRDPSPAQICCEIASRGICNVARPRVGPPGLPTRFTVQRSSRATGAAQTQIGRLNDIRGPTVIAISLRAIPSCHIQTVECQAEKPHREVASDTSELESNCPPGQEASATIADYRKSPTVTMMTPHTGLTGPTKSNRQQRTPTSNVGYGGTSAHGRK